MDDLNILFIVVGTLFILLLLISYGMVVYATCCNRRENHQTLLEV